MHACEHGRRVAWAASQRLGDPVLDEQVAVRAAPGDFQDALADFAAAAGVPQRWGSQLRTRQPVIAWHTVLRNNVCVWYAAECLCMHVCLVSLFLPVCWRLSALLCWVGAVQSLHACCDMQSQHALSSLLSASFTPLLPQVRPSNLRLASIM